MATGWFNQGEATPRVGAGRARARLPLRPAVAAGAERGNLDEAIELARRSAEIGERLGDRDVQATGMMFGGMALVERGDVAEGLAMIDEAALAAISGELAPFVTGRCTAT